MEKLPTSQLRLVLVTEDTSLSATLGGCLSNEVALEVSSLENARGVLSSSSVDVILIDCRFEMTKESLTKCKELRAIEPDAAILVAIDSANPELVSVLLRLNVEAAFSLAQIEEVLPRALRGHARRLAARQTAFSDLSFSYSLRCSVGAVDRAIEQTRNLLVDFLPRRSIRRIELGLNETLRNALEHGAFGITHEEKEALCMASAFDAELERRANETVNRELRIQYEVRVSPKEIQFIITDPGEGFDWRAKKAKEDELLEVSGRGITLIDTLFDSARYNEKGNSITLTLKR